MVDGDTITGSGTDEDPFVANGGSGAISDDDTLEGDGQLATPLKLKKVYHDASLGGLGTAASPLTVVGGGCYAPEDIDYFYSQISATAEDVGTPLPLTWDTQYVGPNNVSLDIDGNIADWSREGLYLVTVTFGCEVFDEFDGPMGAFSAAAFVPFADAVDPGDSYLKAYAQAGWVVGDTTSVVNRDILTATRPEYSRVVLNPTGNGLATFGALPFAMIISADEAVDDPDNFDPAFFTFLSIIRLGDSCA